MAKRRNVLMHPLFIIGILIIVLIIIIRFPITIRLKEIGTYIVGKESEVAYWDIHYKESSVEYFEKNHDVKLDSLYDIDFEKETVIYSVGAPIKWMHYTLFDGIVVKRGGEPARVGYVTFGEKQEQNVVYVYKTKKINLVIPEYAVW